MVYHICITYTRIVAIYFQINNIYNIGLYSAYINIHIHTYALNNNNNVVAVHAQLCIHSKYKYTIIM